MDLSWAQVLVLLFGNLAWMLPLFLWNRSESRADARHFDERLEAHRELVRELMADIHQEMKDFHGRLERQDAEFKAFLKQEEQKRTQILMGK